MIYAQSFVAYVDCRRNSAFNTTDDEAYGFRWLRVIIGFYHQLGCAVENLAGVIHFISFAFIVFFIFIGLLAGSFTKSALVVIGIFSYPAYLILYGVELVLSWKENRKLFRFNLPRSGNLRYASHCLAAFFTITLVYPMGYALWLLPTSSLEPMEFMGSVVYETIFSPILLFFQYAFLIGLYFISWRIEDDERSPLEKITALSVPTLWKSFTGS